MLPTDTEKSNAATRTMKEFMTEFKGDRNPRNMWLNIAQSAACRKAVPPIRRYRADKEGNSYETDESKVEKAVYDSLVEDCGGPDFVTELMMTNACQMYYARSNSSSATFMRDSSGGKPIDETRNTHNHSTNPYANLDDEQLAVIAKALQAHADEKEVQNDENPTDLA